MLMNRRPAVALATLVFLATLSTTHAAFTTPSWTRPADNVAAAATGTTYQEWDVYSAVMGPNAPDVGNINPNGIANVFDSGAPANGAFLTGGNMYSAAGSLKPRVTVPGYNVPGNSLDVLVQLFVQGLEININSLTVNGVPANTLTAFNYQELSRIPLGGPGGAAVEHLWSFTLPSDGASFQLDWNWGTPHAMFDRLSIDTSSTPEPGSLMLLSAGAAMILRRRSVR